MEIVKTPENRAASCHMTHVGKKIDKKFDFFYKWSKIIYTKDYIGFLVHFCCIYTFKFSFDDLIQQKVEITLKLLFMVLAGKSCGLAKLVRIS